MEQNDLFGQIVLFVQKERWNGIYHRDTELLNDLKLTGDDAYEFIIAFGKKFNVNVSDFDFNKYFQSEGDLILPAIFDFILRKKRQPKQKITLGDLEKAIMKKKLI